MSSRRQIGGVIPPTRDELRDIALQYHFELGDDETEFFYDLIDSLMPSYRRIAELPEPKPIVKYPRTPGYQPSLEDNPLRGWYWRCSVQGASSGKLAGKTVALKDSICLAGVPMTNGSALLDGFMPDVDATVVERILDAGGHIIGKATCEDLCVSGGSITSVPAPVRNPHNHAYSAGGSSSGSAALVVNGDVDLTLGADQGGSIRIPASLSGAVGLKATYSLIPYTGVAPLELTVDHVGPICRTVEDVALLLEVVAGDDPMDPRQRHPVKTEEYTKALTGDVKDLTIGVVKEGFGWGEDSVETDAAVREAIAGFEKLGATVKEVSVPLHRDGTHVFTAILADGLFNQVVYGNGVGFGWKGYYDTKALDYFARSRRSVAHSFSHLYKLIILLGHYMQDRYNGHFYAKAQNQTRLVAESYDHVLEECDLLAMPTAAPQGKALPILEDPTPEEYVAEAFSYHLNTCPMDMTGHPSVSVPCAKVDGLPVGLMLTGRMWEDATVLRGAHAFESLGMYS